MSLPIAVPSKIVCIRLNYRDHAQEQGVDLPQAPLPFAKWPPVDPRARAARRADEPGAGRRVTGDSP
jgi:hypothetical protein